MTKKSPTEIPQRLAHPRNEAAVRLGSSVSTVIRLEKKGDLESFSLTGNPRGRKHITDESLVALIERRLRDANRK